MTRTAPTSLLPAVDIPAACHNMTEFAAELIRQLPEIPAENILIEPVGRNTAPCIGLAALHIQKRDPDAVMLVLPSDHRIGDEEAFRRVLAAAVIVASERRSLITIGIRPTGPETGYGYIEQGDFLPDCGDVGTCGVRSIREKPPLEQAREFLRQGCFLWNSGMFVWKVSTILGAIERFLPGLHSGLLQIREALGTEPAGRPLRSPSRRSCRAAAPGARRSTTRCSWSSR